MIADGHVQGKEDVITVTEGVGHGHQFRDTGQGHLMRLADGQDPTLHVAGLHRQCLDADQHPLEDADPKKETTQTQQHKSPK